MPAARRDSGPGWGMSAHSGHGSWADGASDAGVGGRGGLDAAGGRVQAVATRPPHAESGIRNFFAGKGVFITGGSGLVGKVRLPRAWPQNTRVPQHACTRPRAHAPTRACTVHAPPCVHLACAHKHTHARATRSLTLRPRNANGLAVRDCPDVRQAYVYYTHTDAYAHAYTYRKVLIEKILRDCPDVGLIYVLLRSSRKTKLNAHQRLHRDVLTSPCFQHTKLKSRSRTYTAPPSILPTLGTRFSPFNPSDVDCNTGLNKQPREQHS